MGDMIEEAADFVDEVRRENLAATVTYKRGGNSADPAPATRTIAEVEATDGDAVILVRTADYLFTFTDLKIANAQIIPANGDRIIDTIGGETVHFQVTPPDGQSAPYRFMDATRKMIRVHAREVATA